jgi:hypothetical protein
MRLGLVLLLVGCKVHFDDARQDAWRDGSTVPPDGTDAPLPDAPLVDGCAAHASALFCDGFEVGLGAWVVSNGSPQVVTAPRHAGSGALEATIAVQPESEMVQKVLPIGSVNQLYARAWFYAPSAYTYDAVNLFNIDAAGASQGVSIYVYGESLSVYHNTPEVGGFAGPALPHDTWHCAELAVSVADTGGTMRLTLDGQTVIDQTNLDTRPTGGFDHIQVGIPYTGPTQSGPAAFYVDDVVVDVTPIGCAP